MLKFLGIGSCFNTEMGNTSAYYKNGTSLILFDCGETVFDRILKVNLLDNISQIYIYITHLHSDHVGSLPSLIFYLHFVKHIVPTIYYPNNNIIKYLRISGVNDEIYHHIPIKPYLIDIRIVPQVHSKYIYSFGYILKLNESWIYYGGDAKTFKLTLIPTADKKRLYSPYFDIEISHLYIDTTIYTNDAHMNIHDLANEFPYEQRKFVTTMHFDNKEGIIQADKYGFNTAKIG